ncbi:hypothetical protein J3R73_005233 [Labrys monachus]|uniref:Lipoprotein n=2 Tax=Labrys monachus TaxID=217067 RepID=A0ABU0FLF3_9HYPH|nr:hypothetical protein [Labrys monachus]
MRMMKHIVPLALMLLGVAGCATASKAGMGGDEIKARIVGNTVTGVDDGKPYMEYYDPSGSIAGKDTEPYTGSWRIDGNKLCTGYESEDPTKTDLDWTCSGVSVVGDRVFWLDQDGEKTEAKLLPGRQQ